MKMKMKIKGGFFFKLKKNKFKATSLAVFLLIASFIGANNIIKSVNAQTGNFVNGIKTSLNVLDKVNNAEKVDYLSGEPITMSQKIELTADVNITYPNAYLLLKIPKQYLDGEPQIATTDTVAGQELVQDSDYYIKKVKYNSLIPGTISTINFVYKLKNYETPAGYKPEVISELYSENNTLLSRQTKSVNTTKQPRGLTGLAFGLRDYVGEKSFLDSDNVNYVARYSDKQNTTIDRDSIAGMSRYQADIYTSRRTQGGSYGLSATKDATITYFLPPHTHVIEKSLKQDGWVYDSTARTVSKTLTGNLTSLDFPDSQDVVIEYDKDTPEDVLKSSVTHKAKIVVNYADGTHDTLDSTRIKQNLILENGNQGTVEFSKTSARDSENVLLSNPENILGWKLGIKIKNKGRTDPVPVKHIIDLLQPETRKDAKITNIKVEDKYSYQSEFWNYFGDKKLEVVGVKDDNSEISLGYINRNNKQISLPNGIDDAIAQIKFKFPDNYELPAVINSNNQEYKIDIIVEATPRNWKNFKDNLPSNGVDKSYLNKGRFHIDGSENETSMAESKVYKIVTTATNSLSLKDSQSIISPNTDVVFYHSLSALDGIYGYKYGDINYSSKRENSLPKGLKVFYLFDKSMALTDKWNELAAKNNGEVRYIENYKNSGKSALILSGDILKTYLSYNYSIFKVTDFTPNGTYTAEKVTIWDTDDERYKGVAGVSDDLDFHDNGNTTDTHIARSSVTFSVLKPMQIAAKKYVRKENVGSWAENVTKLDKGDNIDYRLSVINTSDRTVRDIKMLDVLPKAGDKKIVENNNGDLLDRGSTVGVTIRGPITPVTGFSIKYSTDEPGNNQDESLNKNFMPADQITDWSRVRMIKIEQDAGTQIQPNQIIDFNLKAKLPNNAPDLSEAKNSLAVTFGSNRLVEGNSVNARVEYPATIEGIAFKDANKNSKWDTGEERLANYGVKILKDNQEVANITTDNNGHYSYSTKDHGTYKVRFVKPASLNGDNYKVSSNTINGGDNYGNNVSASGNLAAEVETGSFTINDNNKQFYKNLGIVEKKSSLFVEYKYTNNTNGGAPYSNLYKKETILDNVAIGTAWNITAKKLDEITLANGLVYSFEKMEDNNTALTGNTTENDKTVYFYYKPKAGASVKAKFVNENGDEIQAESVVKTADTQVGTQYTATKPTEITKDNLVYTFKNLKQGSAPENGRVSTNEQVVTYVYEAKKGKGVKAKFVNENGDEIQAESVVKTADTQVGTQYTATKPTEITKDNLVYTFKNLKQGSAPENGRVSTNEQVVTYVYEAKKGGTVTAKYMAGNTEIKASSIVAQNQQIGKEYSSQPPAEITKNNLKYVLASPVLANNSAPQSGRVTENAQTIIYNYVIKKGGTVTVHYQNESGVNIQNSFVLSPTDTQVGTDYRLQANNKPTEITKDNLVYTFKNLKQGSAPENGRVSTNEQVVTYVYEAKKGKGVKAKFVNENGDEIQAESVVKTADTQVGTQYTATKPTEITKDNLVYTFKNLKQGSAPENGRVSTNEQVVTYVYEAKKGKGVKATFTLKDGKEIKDSETIVENGTQVGTEYTSKKPNEITKDNLVYVYKELADNSAVEKGRVSTDEKIVRYIYEPKKGGEVIASYIDINGNKLQDDITIAKKDTQVGAEYTHKYPEELQVNGKKYKFKEVRKNNGDASLEGKVKEEKQQITVIYEEIVTASPNTGFGPVLPPLLITLAFIGILLATATYYTLYKL